VTVEALKQAYRSHFDREKIEKLEMSRPMTAKGLWVTSIYTGYILVVKSLNNEPVDFILVEESTPTDGDQEVAEALYSLLSPSKGDGAYYRYRSYDSSINDIEEMVKIARERHNYEFMVAAAKKANELLGTRDGIVEIPAYTVNRNEVILPREEAERIVSLGEKIAEIFVRLGGRASVELEKLIFSGFKKGIVNTIEGITDDEKMFLESVLEDPLSRAALLFAYKKVGNYKKLLSKILYSMYFRNIPVVHYA